MQDYKHRYTLGSWITIFSFSESTLMFKKNRKIFFIIISLKITDILLKRFVLNFNFQIIILQHRAYCQVLYIIIKYHIGWNN